MFYVEDQAIYLTRGDSAEVSIDLTTEGGEAYDLGASDTLTLTVRKEPAATSKVIFAKSVTGSGVISITPEDTRNAEIGQYSADIQLTTADHLSIEGVTFSKGLWVSVFEEEVSK